MPIIKYIGPADDVAVLAELLSRQGLKVSHDPVPESPAEHVVPYVLAFLDVDFHGTGGATGRDTRSSATTAIDHFMAIAPQKVTVELQSDGQAI